MPAKLFVGNLSFQATEEDLRELFQQAGMVESVRIVTDQFTGRPRGFGFVEMATKEEPPRPSRCSMGGYSATGTWSSTRRGPSPSAARAGGGPPGRRRRGAAAGAAGRLAPLGGPRHARGPGAGFPGAFSSWWYTQHVETVWIGQACRRRASSSASGQSWIPARDGIPGARERESPLNRLKPAGRERHAVRLDGESLPRVRARLPYCYARPTHEYLGHARSRGVRGADLRQARRPGRLLEPFAAPRDSGQEVAIGTATDPYQPAEARFRGDPRSCFAAMAQVPGLRVGLTTKCTAVTRDLELLQEIAAGSELTVNVSLICSTPSSCALSSPGRRGRICGSAPSVRWPRRGSPRASSSCPSCPSSRTASAGCASLLARGARGRCARGDRGTCSSSAAARAASSSAS